MRVLLVHNDYGAYSGEEAVVDSMAAMLAAAGVEVGWLRTTSAGRRDTLRGRVQGALCGIYSPGGVGMMRRAIRDFRPDVVNVHNLYPFISPAALHECRKAGVPVVMTVHNYRIFCPTGLMLRGGVPCRDCLDRGSEWPCVLGNCEGSLPRSAGYALRNAAARWRRDFLRCVDVFACVSDFQRRLLVEAGLPADRITVIPNAVALSGMAAGAGHYVGYAGRLSREKGADLMVEAARRLPHIPFRFAGAVTDASIVASLPPNADYVGRFSKDDMPAFYADARCIAVPSRCYEGFPMAVLEAAGVGRPAVCPDHGAFPALLGNDSALLFTPGDVGGLADRIERLWDDPAMARALGAEAHAAAAARYSPQAVAARWMDLFDALGRCPRG